MRNKLRKQILLLCFFTFTLVSTQAKTLIGVIADEKTKEPLIGASIQIQGTSKGVISDIDGNYIIENLNNGSYTFEIRYMGYETALKKIEVKDNTTLNIYLKSDGDELDEIVLSSRRNMASENVLAMERKISTIAVENIGLHELERKGVSNVQDGVKKITGISIAEAGEVVVRGLGDRYSLSTLNGMPIASPNPDNKLIPLDIFPSSVVNNVTINKVYKANQFADYSGAHIDISTTEHSGDNHISIGIKLGVEQYVVNNPFMMGDMRGNMLSNNKIDENIWNMKRSDFDNMMKSKDIFGSNFSIKESSSLPNIGVDASIGQTWNLDKGKLSLIASLGIDNSMEYLPDGWISTLSADGTVLSSFNNDKYSQYLNTIGLASLGFNSNKEQNISYTILYARNATNTFIERDGFDAEGIDLKGSNSAFHVYSFLVNQLQGKHKINNKWDIQWGSTFGITQSLEPDRKQVMFRKEDNGSLSLFKLNAQETMRYFGDLNEWETMGHSSATYKYGFNNSKLHFGASFKHKNRDYRSMRMYYNLRNINEGELFDIYNKDAYLNQTNIANGSIKVTRDKQPKDSYSAAITTAALFAETDLIPTENILINLGIRGEYVEQTVHYSSDGGTPLVANLKALDLFPALNLKFDIKEAHILRGSISRTITRPSFIEMAPFLYQEAYGGAEIRGNAELKNGYNYNIDTKYEYFMTQNAAEFIAITAYFKYLDNPIERVQESSGGSAVHSFRNSDVGIATGVEVEIKKKIIEGLNFGANFSYMYTNVKLPEGGGIYTSTSRALQGASPYLGNADISYSKNFNEKHKLNLALVYNLQGPRIHAVGIMGLGDITQNVLHSLDFVSSYTWNDKLKLKINIKNIINNDLAYKQYVPKTESYTIVENRKRPISASLSISYKINTSKKNN